ncbi:MAG: ribokinase [Aggregatilineales bacterium]
MTRLVVVGSFNVDMMTYVRQLPLPGQTIIGHDFATMPGGKGSNQAVAAAKLGADVTFIGRVGADTFGEIGFELWRNVGINTDWVVRDADNSTGVANIIIDDNREKLITVAPGANLALSTADIDRAEDVISGADILITQLEINFEVTAYVLKMAKKYGVTSILNPAPMPSHSIEIPDEMLADASILTPNALEQEFLRQSAKLPANETQALVVTHGRRGIHWMKGSVDSMVPSFPVEVVDSIGGGDAFNGALAVGLAGGMAMEEAIRYGNASAAICLTRRGVALSMPTGAEVEAFLSANT